MITGTVIGVWDTMVNKICKFSANTVLVEQIGASQLWVVTTNLNGIRLCVCVCVCVFMHTHTMWGQKIISGTRVRFLIFQEAAQIKR